LRGNLAFELCLEQCCSVTWEKTLHALVDSSYVAEHAGKP